MTKFQFASREEMEISPATRRAEEQVAKSTGEFEHAMDHLEEAVENTSQRVVRIISTVQETVEEANRKVAETIRTAQDTIHKPKEIYDQASERLQIMMEKGRDVLDQTINRTQLMGQDAYEMGKSAYEKSIGKIQDGMQVVRDRPKLFGGLLTSVLLAGAFGYSLGRKNEFSSQGQGMRPTVEKPQRVETDHVELNKNLRIA